MPPVYWPSYLNPTAGVLEHTYPSYGAKVVGVLEFKRNVGLGANVPNGRVLPDHGNEPQTITARLCATTNVQTSH